MEALAFGVVIQTRRANLGRQTQTAGGDADHMRATSGVRRTTRDQGLRSTATWRLQETHFDGRDNRELDKVDSDNTETARTRSDEDGKEQPKRGIPSRRTVMRVLLGRRALLTEAP